MIEKTFYAILASLHAHRQALFGTSMFSGDVMNALLDGLSDEDLQNMPDLDAEAIYAGDAPGGSLSPGRTLRVPRWAEGPPNTIK